MTKVTKKEIKLQHAMSISILFLLLLNREMIIEARVTKTIKIIGNQIEKLSLYFILSKIEENTNNKIGYTINGVK